MYNTLLWWPEITFQNLQDEAKEAIVLTKKIQEDAHNILSSYGCSANTIFIPLSKGYRMHLQCY